MYTVLIVDDEEPVLDSYAFILESGVSGFCLAGKARSGYEAIKLIYELNPDGRGHGSAVPEGTRLEGAYGRRMGRHPRGARP